MLRAAQLGLARALVAPAPLPRRAHEHLDRMLGQVDGRAYFNLTAWHELGTCLGPLLPSPQVARWMGWEPDPSLRRRPLRELRLWWRCVTLAWLHERRARAAVASVTSGNATAAQVLRVVDEYWEQVGLVDLGLGLVEGKAGAPAEAVADSTRELLACRTDEDLTGWLSRYGMAISTGMRLEDPTWGEDPSALRTLLETPGTLPRERGRAARHKRRAENLRVARSMLAGALRHSLDEDARFLTLDEATTLPPDARQRADTVRVRREQHARWLAAAEPPPRFWGTGYPPKPYATYGDDSAVGCSPGVATGPVRIVRSAAEFARCRDAVAVCERLPPDWAALIGQCAALIVTRASPLSHGMIVARELGIPAVAGIADAMTRFRDGEVVSVDGSTGSVERVG